MKNKKTMKRIIWIAVIALTVVFIWSNSLREGGASVNQSGLLKELLISIGRFFKADWTDSFLVVNIRKVAHFCEYALLGALLNLMIGSVFSRRVQTLVNICFFCVMTALIDETLQYFTAMRTPLIADVWLDVAGSVAGIFVTGLIIVIGAGLRQSGSRRRKS